MIPILSDKTNRRTSLQSTSSLSAGPRKPRVSRDLFNEAAAEPAVDYQARALAAEARVAVLEAELQTLKMKLVEQQSTSTVVPASTALPSYKDFVGDPGLFFKTLVEMPTPPRSEDYILGRKLTSWVRLQGYLDVSSERLQEIRGGTAFILKHTNHYHANISIDRIDDAAKDLIEKAYPEVALCPLNPPRTTMIKRWKCQLLCRLVLRDFQKELKKASVGEGSVVGEDSMAQWESDDEGESQAGDEKAPEIVIDTRTLKTPSKALKTPSKNTVSFAAEGTRSRRRFNHLKPLRLPATYKLPTGLTPGRRNGSLLF
ncbi:FAD-binding domain-containing protein [Pseudohyphozyma bogoriensis]|nr:FAD-binding domain-containing protein [Pseudohyphozyma bogoriensis]